MKYFKCFFRSKISYFDEIDSGLDVDAIKIICEGIVNNLSKHSSLLVITHYPKILTYLKPDFIHIMIDGKIIKTGGIELVNILEEIGYDAFSKSKRKIYIFLLVFNYFDISCLTLSIAVFNNSSASGANFLLSLTILMKVVSLTLI